MFKFLAPSALLFALLIIPIILLYILKIKRKDRTISSVLLWNKVLKDVIAHTPFQKLRANILLILQIIAVLLFATALARPSFLTKLSRGESIVIIIDTSASMKTTDTVDGTRFASAIKNALNIINSIDTSEKVDEVMIITSDIQPQVRVGFTSDKNALKEAVKKIRPHDTVGNLNDALELAISAVKGIQDSKIFILSDGSSCNLNQFSTHEKSISYIKFGEKSDNLGIISFDIIPSSPKKLDELTKKGKLLPDIIPYEIFAVVKNFSHAKKSALLKLFFDEKLISVKEVSLEPQEEAHIVFNEYLTKGAVKLILDNEDSFKLDNTVMAQIIPPTPIKILLITERGDFIKQALESNFYLTYETLNSDADVSDAPDIIIYDNEKPSREIETNIIKFGLACDFEGKIEDPEIVDFKSYYEFFRGVNLSNLYIMSAYILKKDDLFQNLIVTKDNISLMRFKESIEGKFIIEIAFDILETDWVLRPSFAIFVYNIVEYARKQQHLPFIKTGTPYFSKKILTDAIVKTPTNESFNLKNEKLFVHTENIGIYEIKQDNLEEEKFACNLIDERESNNEPAESILIGGKKIEQRHEELITAQLDFWKYIAILLIVLIIIEWIIFHRKIWV